MLGVSSTTLDKRSFLFVSESDTEIVQLDSVSSNKTGSILREIPEMGESMLLTKPVPFTAASRFFEVKARKPAIGRRFEVEFFHWVARRALEALFNSATTIELLRGLLSIMANLLACTIWFMTWKNPSLRSAEVWQSQYMTEDRSSRLRRSVKHLVLDPRFSVECTSACARVVKVSRIDSTSLDVAFSRNSSMSGNAPSIFLQNCATLECEYMEVSESFAMNGDTHSSSDISSSTSFMSIALSSIHLRK
mmetsp:Transcript_35107/g.48702  ORF Transcript_35107/g.48702 Transcript_35107/m.48702 type:complete len:249 (+) Transcript_35107:299-1045(+)